MQGHYSISKCGAWLGLGMDNVVAVPSDAQGRMVPGALKVAITAARARGATPFFVNATAGTTVFGAYDPLMEIADVCQQEGLWLHVDVSIVYAWLYVSIHSRTHYHHSVALIIFTPSPHSLKHSKSPHKVSTHSHLSLI